VNQYDQRFRQMATSQDTIGWRRFMEGMICKEIWQIQQTCAGLQGLRLSGRTWGKGLVTKLLEVTHGQWLYRNVQVHDEISGCLATLRKEELQLEIERQQELGTAGLLDEDCHLAECNLRDLEDSSGEKETYWLLAITAAREAGRLRGPHGETRGGGLDEMESNVGNHTPNRDGRQLDENNSYMAERTYVPR
jgi:hypothetical protein